MKVNTYYEASGTFFCFLQVNYAICTWLAIFLVRSARGFLTPHFNTNLQFLCQPTICLYNLWYSYLHTKAFLQVLTVDFLMKMRFLCCSNFAQWDAARTDVVLEDIEVYYTPYTYHSYKYRYSYYLLIVIIIYFLANNTNSVYTFDASLLLRKIPCTKLG